MNEILKLGQTVYLYPSEVPCTIERLLGSGGQGEVYQANLGGQQIALKWYFPHYLQQDPYLRSRLEATVEIGQPSDKFLWPMSLTTAPELDGFGYIMPLRPPHYKSIFDMMRRRAEPSFWALATAGFQLVDSFFQLHTRGFCYRDISFGNVFFEPNTGDVLIYDNDNVGINNEENSGILGTPSFMAPEVVLGQARPSTQTDLFSLAVLLFYMFMIHHPLEGKKEADIRCFDLPARNKLYGTEALFIYDPKDDSNRPVAGYQDNAIIYWKIYPQFLKDLFTKAFTKGINDPNSGRVQEAEWRPAMIRLRDSIIYCSHCGAENFYDSDNIKAQNGKLKPCWSCEKDLKLPPRIRIGKNIIMLNHDTQLFAHHTDDQKMYDFSRLVALVTQNPNNPSVWGLKNLSDTKWIAITADGNIKDVEPGRSVALAVGTRINLGKVEGEIRL